MFLIGLTGGIATGKSTVSRIFTELGVEVIDADVIAREVVQPGQRAWRKIKTEFGAGVLNDTSGEIDRIKLGHQFVIMDLPLMFESGSMLDYIYKTIVVSCDEDQQLSRLAARSGISEADAQKRMKAQMPLDMKCERANFVIDNSRSPDETRQQVELVFKYLRSSRHHWWLRFVIAGWMSVVGAALVWLVTTIWFG